MAEQHCSVYFGQGRSIIADVLCARDPFSLSPAEVVERVLEAGYQPMVFHARADRWPAPGEVSTVQRDGQVFLVGVDVADEVVSVQEVRPGLDLT